MGALAPTPRYFLNQKMLDAAGASQPRPVLCLAVPPVLQLGRPRPSGSAKVDVSAQRAEVIFGDLALGCGRMILPRTGFSADRRELDQVRFRNRADFRGARSQTVLCAARSLSLLPRHKDT